MTAALPAAHAAHADEDGPLPPPPRPLQRQRCLRSVTTIGAREVLEVPSGESGGVRGWMRRGRRARPSGEGCDGDGACFILL